MASMHSSAYCPTQRTYAMTLANAGSQSGYQSLYSDRRDLDVLEVRKETFIFYPQSSIPTARIAAAGFYYTGEGYTIKCFCCKLTVTRLANRADPLEVHRSRAPDCPFVCKIVTQGGTSAQNRVEDEVDGHLNSGPSFPSDVEEDGPTRDDLTPHGASRDEDVDDTAATTKPHRPAAPCSKAELKKENERLRSEITCRQCKRTRVQTLFLPCRHLVACEECANHMDNCITCDEKILGTVRTFLI